MNRREPLRKRCWWRIREPHQWRVKHLRWALERWSINLLPSSRYDYWRTVRAIASALGR
jgi:hypothetical protein